MVKYDKTVGDAQREAHDLRTNPVMRYLRNKDSFKFNVGDIVIKQHRWREGTEWETTKSPLGAPVKYMYVFENELGIGYIKQLKVDGSGFTSNLTCTINFDAETTRLVLDPDFVDHMLIGQDEFQYNKEYINKKNFRQEAIDKNRKILVSTSSNKKRLAWFHSLKVGDVFWYGDTFDEMVTDPWTVDGVGDQPIEACPQHIRERLSDKELALMPSYRTISVSRNGHMYAQTLTQDHFTWKKVSMTTPYPLEDELCGQQK